MEIKPAFGSKMALSHSLESHDISIFSVCEECETRSRKWKNIAFHDSIWNGRAMNKTATTTAAAAEEQHGNKYDV